MVQSCRGKLTCAKCRENEHYADDCENTIFWCAQIVMDPNCIFMIMSSIQEKNCTIESYRERHISKSTTKKLLGPLYADAAHQGKERWLFSVGRPVQLC